MANIEAMLNSSLDDIIKTSGISKKKFGKTNAKPNSTNKFNKKVKKTSQKATKNALNFASNAKTANKKPRTIVSTKTNRNRQTNGNLEKTPFNPTKKKIVKTVKKRTFSKKGFTDAELSKIKIVAKLDQVPPPLKAQKSLKFPLKG